MEKSEGGREREQKEKKVVYIYIYIYTTARESVNTSFTVDDFI
jgi:hypothetical protein